MTNGADAAQFKRTEMWLIRTRSPRLRSGMTKLTFPVLGIYSLYPVREGRFSRALLKRSRMRRLRARFAPVASGRLGSPSGPTTWLCQSRLDEDRMKAAKAVRIKGAMRACPVPEVRSPRPKSPRWSAARRCASGPPFASQADAGSETRQGAPFGAPRPSCCEGSKLKTYLARLRRENEVAWLFEN